MPNNPESLLSNPANPANPANPVQALDPALASTSGSTQPPGSNSSRRASEDPTQGRGSKKRPLTSHIFLHGVKFKRGSEEWWRCSECPSAEEVERDGGKLPQEYKITGCSTDKPTRHLREAHGLGKNGKIIEQDEPQSKQQEAPQTGIDRDIQLAVFKGLLCAWIVCAHVAFHQVENIHFRNLLYYLNARAQDLLPDTADTVRNWVMELYNKQREEVSAALRESPFRIHWSFDLWTSSNNKPILGIVAHWMDNTFHKRNTLLGMREMEGAHSGANIQATLWKVLEELELQRGPKLGYFMLDNASSNTTALTTLEHRLENPGDPSSFFSAAERRLHCFGHILNLIARRILYGTGVNVEVGQDTLTMEEETLAIQKERDLIVQWRKLGPLGKLRNIVTYVRGSPQRIQRFLAIRIHTTEADNEIQTASAAELLLVAENDTRWNSTFAMIERGLKLQNNVNFFVTTTPDLHADALDAADWTVLKELIQILQPFEKATKALEGRAENGIHGTIGEVLPALIGLKKKLTARYDEYKSRRDHGKEEHLKTAFKILETSVNNGLDHLDKYIKITTEIPVYLAAIVLDPRLKWEGLENITRLEHPTLTSYAEWVQNAKCQVQSLWEQQYKGDDTEESPNHMSSPEEASIDFLHALIMDVARAPPPLPEAGAPSSTKGKGRKGQGGRRPKTSIGAAQVVDDTSTLDEYQRWLKEARDATVTDLIEYWKFKRSSYPRLALMALEILTIPAMSAEVERVFSSAKQTITDRRARLKVDIIEACECLNHCEAAGIIRDWTM
jgi:hypothetical protein